MTAASRCAAFSSPVTPEMHQDSDPELAGISGFLGDESSDNAFDALMREEVRACAYAYATSATM